MDPSERGAVNYFLGMTFCKLFAAELLDTPWLLHFDVFKDVLTHTLIDRSKPDLVGMQSITAKWRAFESKGRTRRPSQVSKDNAKIQAQQLVRLEGSQCDLEIATFSYFQANILQFYWCDPESSDTIPIEVPSPGFAWKYYYRPTLNLILALDPNRRFLESERFYVRIPELDIEISIHPRIAILLVEERWKDAQKMADGMKADFVETGYKSDGISIRAGNSWRKPFNEFRRFEKS